MLASQKLYILAKLDSTPLQLDSAPLPAVQTCPQCVGIVYGSRDACTTSMPHGSRAMCSEQSERKKEDKMGNFNGLST